MRRSLAIFATFVLFGYGASAQNIQSCALGGSVAGENGLCLVHDQNAGTISVFRGNGTEPILTQNAQAHVRPYIHPLVAPDDKGVLTEINPSHHLHQTGIYWGLKMVNGRDYFMACCTIDRAQDDYLRRVSAKVIEERGQQVKWQTVYDLLNENGNTMLTETQTWSMQETDGKYLLDLEWSGEAKMDVTVGKFYVGGLFIRMPWYRGIDGEVINAAGQRNREAETQRAIWTDVGMQIEGRDDHGHIAMFDHPDNNGFPVSWRVDTQLGVGPSRQIMGDWTLAKGETEVIRYRLLVYTGALNPVEMTRAWTEFATQD